MKFFATAAFATLTSAAAIESRGYSPCSGLTGSPYCCGMSVDGVLELDCVTRKFPMTIIALISD